MPIVAIPEAEVVEAGNPDVPTWVQYRGGDVRAYDRTLRREVYGPHFFPKTTDLLLTNGVIRFWVGNRGLLPFVNVDCVEGEKWNHSGVLMLAQNASTNVLLDARVTRLTPDSGTVCLTLRNLGEIFLTLNRGERMIRVQHGSDRNPVSGARHVRWVGAPPYRALSNTTDTGKFGAGHRQQAGDTTSEFIWPADVSKEAWTMAYWWLPNSGSSSLALTGLASIWDSDEELAIHSRFDTTDNKVKMTVGNTTTLETDALTFGANLPVFVAHRVSPTDGQALSVKTPSAAIQHVTNPATSPGTLNDYDYFVFATSGDGTWGEGTWGEGTWGSLVTARGVIDNVMIFDGYVEDAVLDALAGASGAMGGVGSLEGNLVWYAPFDTTPLPTAPSISSGRMVEAAAEADGLKRMVGALASGVSASGFGLSKTTTKLDIVAGLSPDASQLGEYHNQFAASFRQETRIR